MAFFRLILFLVTMFTNPPGLWLYPNLFEDVGFFDSFKPLWAWHEDEKAVKLRKKNERAKKKAKRDAKANGTTAESPVEEKSTPLVSQPGTTGAEPAASQAQMRNMSARVEEVEDDE